MLEKEVDLKPAYRKGLKVLERGDAQNQIPLSRVKIWHKKRGISFFRDRYT